MKKFGVRGVVRGATMGLALVNMVGGGLAYTLGKWLSTAGCEKQIQPGESCANAGSVRLEALQVGIAGENQHGWDDSHS
jgi:hypothetical protein